MKKINHLIAVSTLAVLAISGCGETSTNPTTINPDNPSNAGEVVIGITDAPGDFGTYSVDVSSIKLWRRDGTSVETVPLSTTVDFAQYVELTEFFTAATVPHGVYVAGTMTLDYSNADIQVENDAGNMIAASSIVDSQGEEITQLEMRVDFENANQLIVRPGSPGHITLDFDLQASNTVRFDDAAGASVVVEPLLLAELARERAKTHRARGALRAVNLERSSYAIWLRPFHHRVENDRRFGSLVVLTDDETVFDINGQVQRGESGLTELAAQPDLTATIAVGRYRIDPVRFVATEVYAGTSVPNGDQDVVRGSIVSRDAETVTVKGAQLIRANGSVSFNDTITVLVSDQTQITRQASDEDVSLADVSVGQRVNITGSLSRSASGSSELDATDGNIRLLVTYLAGGVTAQSEYLVVDLSSINGRNPEQFDFTGTGVSEEYDADADAYEVDTATLSLPDVTVNSAVKIAGHVQSFGLAPADFNAQTVADVSELPAVLKVTWIEGTAESVDTGDMNTMTLNL
ncbi:MAG: DUF4382 domain-containing protein, partial [Granulosicoccus sp.]|nr:DUF4382 domain-containing protein [Granulosicoccus sp.]